MFDDPATLTATVTTGLSTLRNPPDIDRYTNRYTKPAAVLDSSVRLDNRRTELFATAVTSQATSPDDAPARVLVVDDDENLGRLISRYLTDHGFDVAVELNGTDGLHQIQNEAPDLVVLDIMLPGMDGLTVCREARTTFDGPILMLTALGDEVDEVAGLETGADDYLAKPVRPRLLLARIRALLRRHSGTADGSSSDDPQTISLGDLVVSQVGRSATLAGGDIELTTAEFDLLWLLASSAGRVLTRDEINEQLRGVEYDGLDRTIDLRISRLRRKIGDDPKRPTRIKSVRGRGYLMVT